MTGKVFEGIFACPESCLQQQTSACPQQPDITGLCRQAPGKDPNTGKEETEDETKQYGSSAACQNVFVANRKVVTEQKDKTTGSNRGAEGARELSEEEDGGGDEDGDPAGARKDPADPGEDGKETGRGGASRNSCFWYGFLQNLSQGFALTDSAVSDALHRFWDGLKEWWHVHVLGDREGTAGKEISQTPSAARP